MLTEEEKKQIRAEETFRHEIQKQFTQEKGKYSRIWKTINSAAFLWFMSTVIVGVVTFSYSKFEKESEERRRKNEAAQIVERENRVVARKIDSEVSNRLYYVAQMAQLQGNNMSADILFILEKPLSADYPVNVFPEFANRNLQSLLWELLQVIPEDEKKDIDATYKQAQNLSSLFLNEHSLKKLNPSLANSKSKIVEDFYSDAITTMSSEHQKKRLQAFNLERWGKPLNPLYLNDKATESGVSQK